MGMKRLITLATMLLVIGPGIVESTLAQTSVPIYKNGMFWVFKIDRESRAFYSTRLIQGTYRIRIESSKM